MRLLATTLVAASTFWLSACGGGGGGGGGSPTPSPPAPAPAPQAQTITFATTGAVSRALSEGSFTNAASGGAGTGAITYSSSNASVAAVSGSGVATFLSAGSTTITATKAADTSYLAATTNYTLTITAEAPVAFKAWMGAADTRVTFTGPLTGLELLRSPQLDCNTANFAACTGGVASSLATTTLDPVAKLGLGVNWWLRRGTSVSPPLRLNGTPLEPRVRASAVSWRGKLWYLGGAAPSPSFTYSAVWNSDDGYHWTQVTPDAGFTTRTSGTYVVFKDRLWLLGGMHGFSGGTVTLENDVWSTGDGAIWRREVQHAPWPGRAGHSALVFNDKLWVIGGLPHGVGAGEGGDDAWSSVDGINWVEESHAAPFGQGVRATVLNGRIYTLGGDANNIIYKDVWSSADGRSWRLENAAPPFAARTLGVFAALGNRLYVAAGCDDLFNNGRRNDVWSSPDGVTWTEETAHAPFAARFDQGSTVHNGRLWILGGFVADFDERLATFRSLYGRDVWSTSDGRQWTEHSPHQGLYPGYYHALAHDGKLWVVGGWDGDPRNDTWTSTDGLTWTQVPLVTGFEPRVGQATAIYNGEFWVSGGGTPGPGYPLPYADVWHSPDGAHWTRATASAAFDRRSGHSMVAFNNKLFLLAGFADRGDGNYVPTSHVFTSTDGATWTPLTQLAPFDPTALATALVFNGRLWLLGSSGSAGTSDAWSSADGSTWRQETPTPLRPYLLRSATVHDGKMFITGGGIPGGVPSPTLSNTVYSSIDGTSWTAVNAGPHFAARVDTSLVSFDNKLWVLGGTDVNSLMNDVWMSEDDGLNWRMRYVGSIPYP